MRFLDLELEEAVPMATTIWLFREALAKAGLIDQLFARFGQHLEAGGYIARGGQIIDATIVSVPKQRNTKEENEAIKAARRRRDGRTSRPRMPRRTGRALDEEERRKVHAAPVRSPWMCAEQFVRVPESNTVPTMAREMRKHGSLGKGNAIESPVGPGCKARRGLYQVRD